MGGAKSQEGGGTAQARIVIDLLVYPGISIIHFDSSFVVQILIKI